MPKICYDQKSQQETALRCLQGKTNAWTVYYKRHYIFFVLEQLVFNEDATDIAFQTVMLLTE
jgi:hypothetical protein